jgi:hypothetical protein
LRRQGISRRQQQQAHKGTQRDEAVRVQAS